MEKEIKDQFLVFLEDTPQLDIELLGNEVMIKLFAYEKVKFDLMSIDGELLSDKYGKEVFNIGKVLKVGTSAKDKDLKEGDIVSLLDSVFDPIPNGSRGFTNEGEPKAGYIALGNLLPNIYLVDKIKEPKNDLIFILPYSNVKVKHLNPKNCV